MRRRRGVNAAVAVLVMVVTTVALPGVASSHPSAFDALTVDLLLDRVLVIASAMPAAGDTTSVTPAATLDCSDPIDHTGVLSAEVEGFGGQVALVTSRTSPRALQASRAGDPAAAPFTYFSKTGMYVRTGTRSAELRIPRSERGRVAISWGNTDHDGIASRVLRVGPCPGVEGWIVFPGGYYVNEPHCVRLIVRVGDRERTVRIGVGAACPGQRPPPPPR